MRTLRTLLLGSLACCRPPASIDSPTPLLCSRSDGAPDHWPTFAKGRAFVGRLAGYTPVNLRVVLPLRDEEHLDAHLAAASDPASPAFGRPLTAKEFAGRHAPTGNQVTSMREHLAKHGLQVGDAAHADVLEAVGDAAAAEAALGIGVGLLAGGVQVPVGRVSVPGRTEVAAVRGLATGARYQNHAGHDDLATVGLTPAQLRRAYRMPEGARGAGQTLAVVTMDGYRPEDLAAYCQRHGIREVPRRHVYVGSYKGEVLSSSGQVETTLDLSVLNAVAPDAREILVLGGKPDDPHAMFDMMRYLVDPPHGEPAIWHVSCSWGAPETRLSEAAVRSEGQLIKALASKGTTLWVASGDLGADAAGDGRLGVDSPASCPWSAAVGGTSLHVSATGEWLKESTWPGTGGGESCFWPVPIWQANLPDETGIGKFRRVPDLALAADPATGYAIIVNGREQVIGGTSAAAPALAAFAATVDGERARVGKGPLGFWPPQLYGLMATADGPACTNDIADGAGNGGTWVAGPGRDDVCGWGSPRGDQMTQALVALPDRFRAGDLDSHHPK